MLHRIPLAAPQVRPLAEPLVGASVDLYRTVCAELLPSPSKVGVVGDACRSA